MKTALGVTAALLCTLTARADGLGPRPHVQVAPAVITPKMTAGLDDPAWANAATLAPLTLSRGDDNQKSTPQNTRVLLLWDAQYLYIRFVCAADGIYSPFTKHDDPLYKGDVVEVFLDAKGDAREWVELEISPRNVTFDQRTVLTAEPVSNENFLLNGDIVQRDYWADLAWNMDGLRTATSIQKTAGKITGWTADIALPAAETLHRLGQDHFSPITLRANFLRYAYPPASDPHAERHLVAANWASVLFGCPHLSPQAMGYVELVPSLSAK